MQETRLQSTDTTRSIRSGLFGLLTILICIASTATSAQSGKTLSDLQKLQAENLKLKIQISQLKANLADREQRIKIYEIAFTQGISAEAQKDSANLTVEQTKLLEDFRKTLGAAPDETFNWDTLKFEMPKKDDAKK